MQESVRKYQQTDTALISSPVANVHFGQNYEIHNRPPLTFTLNAKSILIKWEALGVVQILQIHLWLAVPWPFPETADARKRQEIETDGHRAGAFKFQACVFRYSSQVYTFKLLKIQNPDSEIISIF